MSSVANYISLSRIMCAGVLLLVEPFSLIFFIIYIYCGLSDIADGYIARKTNTTSDRGAKIDSLADGLLFMVVCIIIYPVIKLKLLMGTFIAIILVIRVASLATVYLKYKKISMMHTYGNKATGFMLFLCPILFISDVNQGIIIWTISLIALLSAIEELLIHLTSTRLNINRKSIFTGRTP